MPTPSQADQVPRELAEALLELSDQTNAILVGQVAPELPAELVPADAIALGYVVRFRHSVSVFVVPEVDAKQLRTEMDAALLGAGFEAPAPARSSGFGAADNSPRWPHNRGDMSLSFRVLARKLGGSLLIVSTGPRVERPDLRMRMRHPLEDAPMPQLSDPAGTRNLGGGAGSSGSFSHMRGVLTPAIDVRAALRHYDELLRAEGWEQLGKFSDGSNGFATYKLIDENNKLWGGMFTIAQGDESGTMAVQFALSDLRSDN